MVLWTSIWSRVREAWPYDFSTSTDERRVASKKAFVSVSRRDMARRIASRSAVCRASKPDSWMRSGGIYKRGRYAIVIWRLNDRRIKLAILARIGHGRVSPIPVDCSGSAGSWAP